MRNMFPWMAAGVFVMTASGCLVMDLSGPPFDAAGAYIGSWEGQVTGSANVVDGCAVTLKLNQRTTAPFPGNYRLDGELFLNFTCPSLIWALSRYSLPASATLPVTGLILPGGQIYLGSLGGSGGGVVLASIDGRGYDYNADGVMDALDGDFTLHFTFPGAEPVSIEGDIGLARRR